MEDWKMVIVMLVGLYAAQMAGIFFHELGHALGARVCGWNTLEIRTGGQPFFRKFRMGDVEFVWGVNPFTGLAQVTMTDASRWKMLVFVLGGPLATILIVSGLWVVFETLPPQTPMWLSSGVLYLLFLQGAVLVGSLVPHWTKVDGMDIANDMLQAFQYLTMKRDALVVRVCASLGHTWRVLSERGEKERAQKFLQDHLVQLLGCNLLSARVIGIDALLKAERKEEARQEMDSLLQMKNIGSASRIDVLDGLACLPIYYDHRDLVEEGLGYIDQAIELEPGTITLKGTKSSLLIELGRWEEGLALIEEVVATTKAVHDLEISSYYRALAISKSGDQTKARQLLAEAIDRYPACIVRKRLEKLVGNDAQ